MNPKNEFIWRDAAPGPEPDGSWAMTGPSGGLPEPDRAAVTSERIGGLAALTQAVYLLLHTERGRFLIYPPGYGLAADDLFGAPIGFVRPELTRRIREALAFDDRVLGADGFAFDCSGGRVRVSFTLRSAAGETAMSTVLPR
jgi:hypothetical protein